MVRSSRKAAPNVTINNFVESAVLKSVGPIHGEATTASVSPGPVEMSINRSDVLVTALAADSSRAPILAEMNRVAAAGIESKVKVVKMDNAAARSDTSPICAKFKTRNRRT